MGPRWIRQVLAAGLVSVIAAAGCGGPAAANDPAARRAALEAFRHSPAAEVYRVCKDSVVNIVAIRTEDPKPPETKPAEPKSGEAKPDEAKPAAAPAANPRVVIHEFASGFVLDESGYILTNAHVLRYGGDVRIGFQGGKEYPARVVAFDESKDLAVFKIDPEKPLTPIKFGRSADLEVGEPVVVMGNPFGVGLSVSCGIVSAVGRSTKCDYTFFPSMIQTDAATNPGNSGGPLLNVFGEVVGINSTTKLGANSMGFAIPIDHVREALPETLDPEGRLALWVGIRVATDGVPRVAEVAKGSPAEAAGVRAGDVVLEVGKKSISGGIGFYLALLDAKAEQPLALRLLRDGRPFDLTVKPAKVEPRAPDKAEGAAQGLLCEFYEGDWDKLPDFGSLKAASSAKADTFDLGPHKGKSHYALRFTGYVDVPAEGNWEFYVSSDDGSCLAIGDRVVVDNDGVHMTAENRGFIPLKAGRHAITVTYFQKTSESHLAVSWEGPGIAKKTPIPPSALSSTGK